MSSEQRRLAGRYVLEAPIGRGGMGEVWRGTDPVLGRQVAVKTIDLRSLPDESGAARFEREARATAGLSHPNVVTVHDSGVEGDTAYIVMELLPGPSLLIGTQTPQVSVDLLDAATARLSAFDAVLGPTTGAGWWAFGVRDPEALRPLLPALADTAGLALAALRLGLRVGMLPTLRAVETVADVAAVAGSCRAGSRFAATAARLDGVSED